MTGFSSSQRATRERSSPEESATASWVREQTSSNSFLQSSLGAAGACARAAAGWASAAAAPAIAAARRRGLVPAIRVPSAAPPLLHRLHVAALAVLHGEGHRDVADPAVLPR